MGSRLAVTLPEQSGLVRAPEFLTAGLPEIAARVDAAGHVAVLLDFDGTLAAIAPTPELARMDPAMRGALLSLRRKENVIVAILSGRALEDVRERVGVPELIYSGCHGLTISGGGLDFVHPRAPHFEPALRRLAEQLQSRLWHIAGLVVEFKQLGLSIHCRQVAMHDRAEVAEAVRAVVRESGESFRTSRGKEVWEISPPVDWDKGRAARWILAHAGGRDALPIVIGDDATDEDAFVAVQEGITIKVGYAGPSAASWTVAGPDEVKTFLLWLWSRLA